MTENRHDCPGPRSGADVLVIETLIIIVTSFSQQVCSSMNSRARNRSSYQYHALTAFLSHGFFVVSLGILMEGAISGGGSATPVAYVISGGLGSLLGTWISTRLESLFGSHVN